MLQSGTAQCAHHDSPESGGGSLARLHTRIEMRNILFRAAASNFCPGDESSSVYSSKRLSKTHQSNQQGLNTLSLVYFFAAAIQTSNPARTCGPFYQHPLRCSENTIVRLGQMYRKTLISPVMVYVAPFQQASFELKIVPDTHRIPALSCLHLDFSYSLLRLGSATDPREPSGSLVYKLNQTKLLGRKQSSQGNMDCGYGSVNPDVQRHTIGYRYGDPALRIHSTRRRARPVLLASGYQSGMVLVPRPSCYPDLPSHVLL